MYFNDESNIYFNFCSKKKHLHQTYFNDPDINSKLNLKKPVNFIIHGWLGGLNGGNVYLPIDVKQSAGNMHRDFYTYIHIYYDYSSDRL